MENSNLQLPESFNGMEEFVTELKRDKQAADAKRYLARVGMPKDVFLWEAKLSPGESVKVTEHRFGTACTYLVIKDFPQPEGFCLQTQTRNRELVESLIRDTHIRYPKFMLVRNKEAPIELECAPRPPLSPEEIESILANRKPDPPLKTLLYYSFLNHPNVRPWYISALYVQHVTKNAINTFKGISSGTQFKLPKRSPANDTKNI